MSLYIPHRPYIILAYRRFDGNMFLSILRTDVWQSRRQSCFSVRWTCRIFWRRDRSMVMDARFGAGFRDRRRSRVKSRGIVRQVSLKGNSRVVYRDITNERARSGFRLAFWSMPTGVSISEGTGTGRSGRSMGRRARRRSSRSRNRSSSRPSRLSTDHPAMLTLCCPCFHARAIIPATALSNGAISSELWASFNRSWTFTLKVPNCAMPMDAM